MTNGSVRRGAARQVLQSQASPISGGQLPTIQFATGGAEIFERISQDALKLQNNFHNQLDQQAAAEGEREGANDGQTGNFELQDFGTIRGRAYNKAASETFLHTVETDASRKSRELFDRYRNDPKGLQNAMDAYAEGTSGPLNELNPLFASAYKHRMSIRADAAVARAKEIRFAEVKDQAAATELEASVALNKEITDLSTGLFSKNAEVSATSATALQQLTSDFMAIYNRKDENGRPLFTAKERTAAGIRLQTKVTKSAMKSWFAAQPDKAAAYNQVLSGKFRIQTNRPNVPAGNVGVVYNRLIAKGWTHAQVSGIIGNLQQESGKGLSLKAVGDGGTAFGVAQWRHERLTRLQQFAKANKMDWRSIEAQADFIDFELKTTEKSAGNQLKRATTPQEAAHAFISFERPAGWKPDNPAGGHGYLKRVRNALRLSQSIGKGKKSKVDLMANIPEQAREQILADMRQQITFQNRQDDRAERAEEKAHKEAQAHTAFADLARYLGQGTKDAETGEVIKAPTIEELKAKVRRDELSPQHGEALLRAITTRRPESSDSALRKELIARANMGQDISGDILAGMDRLSASDTQSLFALNSRINRPEGGGMSAGDKEAYAILKTRINTRSFMDKIDDAKQERVAAALQEYVRRTSEGEVGIDIIDDIARRVTVGNVSKLKRSLQRLPKPRFFEMNADGSGIDVGMTKKRLSAARAAKKISESSFLRQVKLLRRWFDVQQELQNQERDRK